VCSAGNICGAYSRHPERVYDWIAEANIIVPEVLLVPLYLGGKAPLGTLCGSSLIGRGTSTAVMRAR
jgi:hypothetical protein